MKFLLIIIQLVALMFILLDFFNVINNKYITSFCYITLAICLLYVTLNFDNKKTKS